MTDTSGRNELVEWSGFHWLPSIAPTSTEYAEAVVRGIEANEYEIGYGRTNNWKNKSRTEPDQLVTTQLIGNKQVNRNK